ncbi:MAG TPA: hypothetical protein VN253_25450 [Kofleriaceae bacterium]|nr:hypothetical protein [Kofleriaceae bacterium]
MLLLLLAAGCTRSAPALAPAQAQPQQPPPGPAAAAPAPVTCGDAGVLLRGTVEDQKQAGPAKEAAIAHTCRFEKWPAEVLQCIGGRAEARPCLDKLSADQRDAYDKALAAWNEAYPDEYLEERDAMGDLGLDDYVDCSDAIKDVASYAPAVTLTGDDRDFVVDMRKEALLGLCEDWSSERRACFRDAGPAGIDACRAQLEPVQARAVTDKLAELDRLGAKLATQKKRPAAFDCKQVVAVHYADAAWKGTMEAVKGADRAKAIAASRARMTKACTDDKWSPSVRACIAAGGGQPCFTTVPYASWRFPAVGVHVRSGIAECDAYAETVKAVTACTSLAQSTRDAIQRAWEQLSANAASVTADRRQSTADTCRQIDTALRRSLASAGCKI